MIKEKDDETRNDWELMEKQITETAEHAKGLWGFACLSNSTTFKWDIGTEVYFVLGDVVRKGIVCSISYKGTCEIRYIPGLEDSIVHLASTRIYSSAYYALKEAEYRHKCKENEKE